MGNQQSGNVYGIQCVDDGVMLDVRGGKIQNGQHVIMHQFNNQDNQRWCTEVASNVIRCKANQQLALDSDKDDLLVIQHYHPGSHTQHWKITPEGYLQQIYTCKVIALRSDNMVCLSALPCSPQCRPLKVKLQDTEMPNNPPKTVHFTIKEDESGEEDKVLDICKASMRSNQQVITFRNRFRDNQLWLCEPLTNIIRSKKNPMFVLDTHNDELVINSLYDNCPSQQWRLTDEGILLQINTSKAVSRRTDNKLYVTNYSAPSAKPAPAVPGPPPPTGAPMMTPPQYGTGMPMPPAPSPYGQPAPSPYGQPAPNPYGQPAAPMMPSPYPYAPGAPMMPAPPQYGPGAPMMPVPPPYGPGGCVVPPANPQVPNKPPTLPGSILHVKFTAYAR